MTRTERVADDTCQLCLEKKLSFAAPPMDCARCGALLKSNSSFYVTAEGMGTRYYFCTPCKNSRGRTISVKEQSFFKDQLVRCLSVEGPDEPVRDYFPWSIPIIILLTLYWSISYLLILLFRCSGYSVTSACAGST